MLNVNFEECQCSVLNLEGQIFDQGKGYWTHVTFSSHQKFLQIVVCLLLWWTVVDMTCGKQNTVNRFSVEWRLPAGKKVSYRGKFNAIQQQEIQAYAYEQNSSYSVVSFCTFLLEVAESFPNSSNIS